MKDHYKYEIPLWFKFIREIDKSCMMIRLHEQSLETLNTSKRYQECVRESMKSRLSAEDFYRVASRVGFDYKKAHEIAADDKLLKLI